MLWRETNDTSNYHISSTLCYLSFMRQIRNLFNFIQTQMLCDDTSLPSNKMALKHSRYETNCSELEIS